MASPSFPPAVPASNRATSYPTSVPAADHDQLTLAVSSVLSEMGDYNRCATGFEIFPATMNNSGSGITLTSGRQEYAFFRALSTTTVTKVKVSTQTAASTTTHAWVGIYDVDASDQPTTLLASSADLTTFALNAFISVYSATVTNNQFTISWTPSTLYKKYALGLLWTGTGSPQLHGQLLDAGAAAAGYSTTVGTAFCAQSNATGLTALVPTGNPAETSVNLVTNSRGIRFGALFLP